MVKKVVIFGGAGFIGTHFRALYKERFKEEEILSLDIEPDEGSVYCDVRQPIDLGAAEVNSDTLVINLAAVHKTPGHPDYDYFEANILGARNVCALAESHNIRKMMFTSSIAPYGASEELKKETTLPTPNTPYGISKLVAEEIHKAWSGKSDDRRLLILRPGVVFGKGENGNFTRLASAIKKGIFFYPGRRDTIKACIYVKELVYQAAGLIEAQDTNNETYNFAYYPSYTIQQIAELVADVTNHKKPKVKINAGFMRFVAKMFQIFGLSKLGIHPARVKKLMTSTNVHGERLFNAIEGYKYSLTDAVKDWHQDCEFEELK